MPNYIINVEHGIVPTPDYIVIDIGVGGGVIDPPDPVFEADYGGLWSVRSVQPSFNQNGVVTTGGTLNEVNQCKLLSGRLATTLEQWSKRAIGNMFGVFDCNKYILANQLLEGVTTTFNNGGELLQSDSNFAYSSNVLSNLDLVSYTITNTTTTLVQTHVKSFTSSLQMDGLNYSITLKTIPTIERNHVIRFGDEPSLEICQDYPEYYQNGRYIINVTAVLLDKSVINVEKTPTYQICKLIQKGDSFPIFSEVEIPVGIVVPPSVIIPPTRNTYMFNHTIQCFRNSDDTEINVISANVSISKEQLHYTISLRLGSAGDKALIKGQEFRLIINGFEFHAIAEKTTVNESFGKSSYSATGRSLSVKLTEPYVLPRTYTNTVATTWRQAIEAEAALAGFTVTYEGFHSQLNLDWALPTGVISYIDKTPLQAISRLCEVVGAVCNSHPSTETIIIKPRYKVPLWLLSGATEDFIISDNLHSDVEVTEVKVTAYDSLYLSGENQGVNRHVKISGAAGDKPKARILDAMFTDQIATVERGIAELSNTGEIIHATTTTHLFYNDVNDQLPPIPIGSIVVIKGVKYDLESMSIIASRTKVNKVRQQLNLIRRE